MYEAKRIELEERFKKIKNFTEMGRKVFNNQNLTIEQVVKRIQKLVDENIELKNKLTQLKK